MIRRLSFGIPAAVLLVLLVFWGSLEMMLVAASLCAALGVQEFSKLFFSKRDRLRETRLILCVVATIVGLVSSSQIAPSLIWYVFAFLGIQYFFLAHGGQRPRKAVEELALELLGCVYVVSLFGFLVPIAGLGREYLFLFFLIVFIGDTAAYFIGMKFGKHKLSVNVSPKKSLEGAAGALVFSVLVTLVWVVFNPGSSMTLETHWKLIVVSPVLSVFAQLGDLFESVLKRSANEKDSGAFLPGHGGILDRVDGFVFTAPVYYFFLIAFGGSAV